MVVVWAGATVLVTAGAVALLPVVLRRLPEPAVEEGGTGPGYARLARPSTVLLHLGTAVVSAAVVLLRVPAETWPLWWPLLSVGLACAVVDARTTWIPRSLCRVGWVLGVVSAVVALGLTPVRAVLVAVLGALAAGVLLWLVWRLSHGIGFGDVRLVPLVGLAAGSLGVLGWWWGLLLGTLLGAVVSVLRRLLRRPGPMPYAPALVAGPLLAALLGW